MIKIAPATNDFHNFKCGEIFCISPVVYNVTCCLCAAKVHLEQFPSHFQMLHLALAEESINLEELEHKRTEKLPKYINHGNSTTIKEEDPEDDPIKQEEADVLNTGKKLEGQSLLSTETEVAENFANKILECDAKELENSDDAMLFKIKSKTLKESTAENEYDPSKEENHIENFDSNEFEVDRDWLEEDESWKSDTEDVIDSVKDELPYPCHICKRSFRSKHGLHIHNKIVHNTNKAGTKKPKVPKASAAGNDSVKDELSYPCHICKRPFRSKHGLHIHNKIVHNPNKNGPKKPKLPKVEHKCDQCNQIFRIARDLRGHKWKHTGIFCDICGKVFTQTGNMMRHKLRHTGIKDHKCNECGKEFFTDKELKSHIICHTGLMPVICELCGKQCRHRGVLTAHMRRHTGERPAKCDVCGKCFFSIHDLNVHAVAHTNERPFKCDICGSTFQRKKALRIHKLIHSKDRKHVCKICSKGFAQSGGLKSHMRTHNTALEKATIQSELQPFLTNKSQNSISEADDCFSGQTTSTSRIANNSGDGMCIV